MSQVDLSSAPYDAPEGTADRHPNLRYDEMVLIGMTAEQQEQYQAWWQRYAARRDATCAGAARPLPAEALAVISRSSNH